ncbi:MAG: PAS domain-containing sensor histidine kinase [Gammaproteobacteria bacterium]
MKRAQQDQYKVSLSLLRDLLDQSGDAFIAVRAQDGRITYANEQACLYLDAPRETLTGQPIINFVEALQKAGWPSVVEECRRVKRTVFETGLANRDGERLIEVSICSIESGNDDYLVATVRDITDRKWTESVLVNSEHRFRILVEHSLVGVYLIQHGNMIYANPHLAQLFGYENEAMMNKPVAELVHPDDLAEVMATLYPRESEYSLKIRYEFRARHKNGSFFPVEIYGSYIDLDGEPATIGTLLDITERKKVEIALRESEERLRLTLKAAQQGWYDLNIKTGEAKVSAEYADILGYQPETFTENVESWLARMHPEDREVVMPLFQAYIEGKIPEYRVEFRQQTRSGHWKWILSIGSIVERNEQGEALRMLGTHRDITQRKKAEQAVRKLNEELEARVLERTQQLQAANQELETFTYTVSHDLKAPLRGIDGYSRLLQEDCKDNLDSECNLFIDNIRRGVRQMSELIEDLLAYSRVERRALKLVQIQVAKLIEHVKLEKKEELEALGAAFTVNLPEGLTVKADFNGLMMVMRNLVDNAVKFSRDSKPPILDVGGRVEGQSCLLWVRDNGIGFDMKFHDRIFDIFQHLERAEDYPGTGIGLTIVRKAMQRMGGRIWAESVPGQGATFYLVLPL